MDENLFGEPFDMQSNHKSTEADKKKRRWENAFQRWSNKVSIEGNTHYGACGYGVICDYCKDSHIGRPCVRAFNEYCRTKRKTPNYDELTFEQAFDGELCIV